ncbi:1,4-alpha-glucan branching enzyme [Caldanaerobius fijiensis DSM 17918]|uniref:1,4-alpha-glucan branching enzyme n=1 Tax=Caldanaerobius fijiensis DSM 17918 TaxID=1121256 RepID=A0A1M4VIB8_9THEO|nr:1,4-alpha-glucan branching protein domain-containing protein [Caldanaerobius fijiensis]SHE68650.1 1,4-alpha-glucan branching enzyme [Caldanaerobius fijiensis DSM 17918]
MPKGYVAMILHAHLPYVRHPEHPDFLEERWFYEAMSECYIPLLDIFNKLREEKIPYRISMTLTPTLAYMMIDPLLQKRYLRYLDNIIALTEQEIIRTKDQKPFNELAIFYNQRYKTIYNLYIKKYNKDVPAAIRDLQDSGYVEILSSAATHGFLPFMSLYPESIKAQISLGVDTYRKFFGKNPMGFWLPECAYTPEIDEFLKREGIKYIILETHGLIYGKPRPKYGVYAPILTPSGIAAFGRDVESSKQVWSATEGYPGDYNYREFYRDIGFEADYDYIKPFIHPDGIRLSTGIKYYRITGKTEQKQPYVRQNAVYKAAEHAANFMFNREQQINYLSSIMDRPPLVVCPYDAELFGHWWFEGPEWLDCLLRKTYFDTNIYQFITLSDYLNMFPVNQVVSPNPSSWGNKGYYEVWLNASNDWIYRHLHRAEERMTQMANAYKNATGIVKEALNQAARELLLAQASDWAFIMDSGTTVDYAKMRFNMHIERFNKICDLILSNNIDESWLRAVNYSDNIFPDIDYSVYASEMK